ncbi:SDR family oxidoreductase [Hymenobacter sublimis]|uniref:SDR family oxidoreductase n=1 Tax=Hymenobacter sublimis TaxID=2933777 RepID=A0ABY4J8M9_9BACT|nr:SDR family oxidoreductase [Hymenobacter sublimis]UPL47759.1 SDR family oxidoreductase [Hymenobacter sublimis]
MKHSSVSALPATGVAPTLLISGATGTVGTQLARRLAAQGVPFRALVRDVNSAPAMALQQLPGAELVTGDLNDPASVGRALVGMKRAFLLTPSSAQAEAQQVAFVEQAQLAGVQHVVKLSQWAAEAESPVRFLRYHAVVEAAIRASGLAYTFLRPNLFMQGLLAFQGTIAAQGQFFAPVGEARISVVDVRDIAAAAAAALTETGHENRTYDLTGPQALTHADMACALALATDRPVTFLDVPPAAMRGALLGLGMDPWMAEGLVEDYAHYHRGEAATVAPGVQQATGRAPRSFASFARDYAPAFGAPAPVVAL